MLSDSNKIREINQTLITLIPKVDEPIQINQLSSIVLCNVSYKIVSKIIAERLESIMPRVVVLFQDHLLMITLWCSKTIHTLYHLHGSKGFMILKLDLEKVCDKLE